jgi:predicted acetyltransferase
LWSSGKADVTSDAVVLGELLYHLFFIAILFQMIEIETKEKEIENMGLVCW